ncbi:MAG: Gfo/Idh/MocA family oxidoreductase, partial [Promethearchaeota archaeon]
HNYTGLTFKSLKGKIKKRKMNLLSSYKDIKKEYLEFNNLPELKTGVETYSNENVAFIKSVIEETPPNPSLEVGLRAHEIIEAAYNSSKNQKLVDLTQRG